jgi:hypothetical protein
MLYVTVIPEKDATRKADIKGVKGNFMCRGFAGAKIDN